MGKWLYRIVYLVGCAASIGGCVWAHLHGVERYPFFIGGLVWLAVSIVGMAE
jgi:hypothetical protein